MSTFRYSRWDGSQQLPPFDADDVLEALSDDLLAEGDVRRALQRLMQRGMQADFSWAKPAQAYTELYTTALARRRGAAVPV